VRPSLTQKQLPREATSSSSLVRESDQDNIDIKAATAAGIMVVNAPTSNVISAAELAIGHLTLTARFIPDANASTKAGQWKRSQFTGVEFFDKTVGICRARTKSAHWWPNAFLVFGVNLIAFDPFVPPARAQQLGVQMVELDALMGRADSITIHIPKTAETTWADRRSAIRKGKANTANRQRRVGAGVHRRRCLVRSALVRSNRSGGT